MSIGIYKIENRINGKIYIGQSWNIENRIKSHKAREHNAHLRASYAKYGIENFTFGTIRRISESGLTQILLDALEVKYIAEYNSFNPAFGYNKTSGGLGGKKSEEMKEFLRTNMERRRKISESHKGVKMSKEHLERYKSSHWSKDKKKRAEVIHKVSETKMGVVSPRKGKNFVEQYGEEQAAAIRAEMSRTRKGRSYKMGIVRCPYCNKEGGGRVMKRWHFENCKNKPTET